MRLTLYPLAADDPAEDTEDNEPENGVPVMPERLSSVIEALEGVGVVLPEDTDASTFFDRLETALLTLAKMEETEVGTENLEPSEEVAALSLESQAKEDSPETKFITKQHRSTVMQQLSLLLKDGQCTPAEFEEQQKSVDVIRLSLNNEGEHTPTAVETWIKSRQAVPPRTFWSDEQLTRMSTLEPLAHPAGTTDVETEESAQAAADEILGVKK